MFSETSDILQKLVTNKRDRIFGYLLAVHIAVPNYTWQMKYFVHIILTRITYFTFLKSVIDTDFSIGTLTIRLTFMNIP